MEVSTYRYTGFLFLALFIRLLAISQVGIEFSHGTWTEILSKAKAENKMVFVDVYTDWCGPCKLMAKNIFPLKEVGDTFNTHFINYKIDAEKGEGIQVAAKYKVTGYPTYLFVNGEGTLIYRSVGSMPEDNFLREAANAKVEYNDPKPFPAWEDEYEARKNDKDFVWAYIQKRKKLRLTCADQLDQYFSLCSKEEILTSELIKTFHQFQNMNVDGPFYSFLLNNKEEVKKKVNAVLQSRFDQFLIVMANADVDRAIASNDEVLLGKIVSTILSLQQELFPVEWNAHAAKMKFYTQTENPDELKKVLDAYSKSIMTFDKNIIRKADSLALDQFDKDVASGKIKNIKPENLEVTRKSRGSANAISFAYRVRDMAKSAFTGLEEKPEFKKALDWMDLADQFSDNFTLIETRAGLLYKMGKVKEGIEWQNKALAVFNEQMAAAKITSEKSLTRITENLAKMKAGEPTW